MALNKLKDAQEKAVEMGKEWTAVSRSALSGFIDDLRQGKTAIEALEGALDKVADKLLDMALDQIFVGPSGQNGNAIARFFASIFGRGYDKGGYTGDGAADKPAGVVHKGEFVFDKSATARIGVRQLTALQRGYRSGGYVGGAAPSMGATARPGVYVSVENNMADKAESTVEGSGTAGDPLRIVVDAVKKDFANGGADKVMSGRFQVSPRRRSR